MTGTSSSCPRGTALNVQLILIDKIKSICFQRLTKKCFCMVLLILDFTDLTLAKAGMTSMWAPSFSRALDKGPLNGKAKVMLCPLDIRWRVMTYSGSVG